MRNRCGPVLGAGVKRRSLRREPTWLGTKEVEVKQVAVKSIGQKAKKPPPGATRDERKKNKAVADYISSGK